MKTVSQIAAQARKNARLSPSSPMPDPRVVQAAHSPPPVATEAPSSPTPPPIPAQGRAQSAYAPPRPTNGIYLDLMKKHDRVTQRHIHSS